MKIARNTVARTEILKLIRESGVALSHGDLQTLLGDLCNRVTIYRVLDRLVEERLIHKVVDIDGRICFAACRACTVHHLHNHIHFSCTGCHTVTCMEQIVPEFQLPPEYQVQSLNFTVSGLCPKCAGG